MANHILTAQEAAVWRDELDARGEKLVFTNGCFDILHVGHVRYLRESRALGDYQLVALNADASVRAVKGEGRPVNPVEDRAEVLCGLESVDRVVIFEEPRVTGLLETIRPHVYTKGGDYTVDSLIVEERQLMDREGIEIKILSEVKGQSTSATLAKLQGEPDGERKLRLAVLGSGNGSNYEAVAQAIENGDLDAEIRLVFSDLESAPILAKAKEHGNTALFIAPGDHPWNLSLAAQKEIMDRLAAEKVDLLVLAGFMRIIKPPLLENYAGRILNVHPSLLPDFPGKDAPAQALAAGASETGCTVHVVDAGIDTGEVLAQAKVPIEPGDTADRLHARIQKVEHELYPKAIGEFGTKLL